MVERLIAQLAHVEVMTPKPEQSAAFFKNELGLEESGRAGDSVYFRGWGEFFHHSLQLTHGPAPAIAHTGWRTEGPKELEACVKRLEACGAGVGWQKPVVGHGAAYRFHSPGGHVHEVFWESERYTAPAELAPTVPNRPQRYITRGAGARQIDHVTFNTDDPLRDAKWFQETLGFRLTEYAKLDHAPVVVTAFISSTPMSHDLGLVLDAVDRTGKLSGVRGRANHVAFWVDTREDVLRGADIYREAGLDIEYGPSKHGVGENFFLLCTRARRHAHRTLLGRLYAVLARHFPVRVESVAGIAKRLESHHMIPDGYLFGAFPPLKEPAAGREAPVLAGNYRVPQLGQMRPSEN